MAIREPRKPTTRKLRSTQTAQQLIQSSTTQFRAKHQNADKSKLSAATVKSAWIAAVIDYRDQWVDGHAPAVAPATAAGYALFVKRAKAISWGSTAWADLVHNVVVNWDGYLTRFTWRTYNFMPGAPDLMFLAMNLREFLKYYQEPELNTKRAQQILDAAAKLGEQQARKPESPSEVLDQLRDENAKLKSAIHALRQQLALADLRAQEQNEQLKEAAVEMATLRNWAKANGYSKETDILDAIYGDYELPGKMK
jgi:hypothetical protein